MREQAIDLSSLYAQHQSYAYRYGTGVYNKIAKQFANLDAIHLTEIIELYEQLTPRDKKLLLQGKFTTRRLKSLKDTIDAVSIGYSKAVSSTLGTESAAFAKYEVGHTEKVLSATLGDEVVRGKVKASTVTKAARQRPIMGYSTARWVKDIGVGLNSMLRAQVTDAASNDETGSDLRRRIKGTAAGNYKDGELNRIRRKAETTTRTALNHVGNQARDEVYAANGVKEVMWRSVLDGRTSKICASRDGTVYPINKGHRPPAHPNCRSVMLPYPEGIQGERGYLADKRTWGDIPKDERKGKDGFVSASTNYEQWFAKQPPSFQKSWLGKTRYELYKKGEYKISGFVDKTGKQYSLDALKRKDRDTFKKLGLVDKRKKPTRRKKTPKATPTKKPTYQRVKVGEQHTSGIVTGDTPTQKQIQDDLLFKGSKTKGEHGVFVNTKTGTVVSSKRGRKGSVDISNEVHNAIGEGYTMDIHHNHPNGASLSPADLYATQYNGVGKIVAYGEGGDSVYTGKALIMGRGELSQIYRTVQKSAQVKMQAVINDTYKAGEITPDEIHFLYWHVINSWVAKLKGIEYQAKFTGKARKTIIKHKNLLNEVM